MRSSRSAFIVSSAVVLWLTVGAALNFAAPGAAIVGISALGLAHSVLGFLSHGGSRISAPGVYMLGTGLFAFFPGIYLSFDATFATPPYLLAAVNVCFFGQVLSYYFWWKPTEIAAQPAEQLVDARVARWGMQMGTLLVVLGSVASVTVYEQVPSMIDAAVFSGAVLLAVAIFRAPRRLSLVDYALIIGALLAYVLCVFDGFGRLTIGALGIALAMAATHKWRGRIVKVALLSTLAPAILILAATRVQFTASLNPQQGPDVTGLESVVGPLFRFSQLLELDANGLLSNMNGSSFLTAIVSLVPRSLWQDKPIGFGAELAELFRPDLAGTGHSEAALFQGEWLFNFGWLGLVLMLPVVALGVGMLDRGVVRILVRPMVDRRDLLLLVALVIVGASLVDLVWGGAFTYTSRTGTRLLVVFGLWVLFSWKSKTDRTLRLEHGASTRTE